MIDQLGDFISARRGEVRRSFVFLGTIVGNTSPRNAPLGIMQVKSMTYYIFIAPYGLIREEYGRRTLHHPRERIAAAGRILPPGIRDRGRRRPTRSPSIDRPPRPTSFAIARISVVCAIAPSGARIDDRDDVDDRTPPAAETTIQVIVNVRRRHPRTASRGAREGG
jgi:hypothetical protein